MTATSTRAEVVESVGVGGRKQMCEWWRRKGKGEKVVGKKLVGEKEAWVSVRLGWN